MRFTLEWLAEHLAMNDDVSLDRLCHLLTQQGLEVEGVQDNITLLQDFVIAEVTECGQHPDADTLKLCQVFDGKNHHQVICGAPNAKLGMKGVFAPIGTYVPGSDFTIKQSKIRGIESQGMLCSERELQISDAHEGIIELPETAPIGENYARYVGLDDVVIEIAVTPNRGDCLGVRGIARDLAAAGIGTLKPLKIKEKPALQETITSPIKWHIDLPNDEQHHCPYIAGRYVSNVNNKGETPLWMRRRLKAIGVKLISPLVDITNYITFDLARPLHVFDADKINGDLTLRKAVAGDKITALDDNDYECSQKMSVIVDKSNILSLAGVMGGVDSGCAPETQNIFIEAALFDAVNVAETGRALNINSDARFRFERKIDSQALLSGLDYASHLVQEICGGEVSALVSAGDYPDATRNITFHLQKLASLGGVNIAQTQVEEILTSLGFEILQSDEKKLQLAIPSFRPDIEYENCLVEEILRIYGYDNIPTISLPRQKAVANDILTLTQKRVNYMRRALCVRGLNEAYSWSFCDSTKAVRFWGADAKPENLRLQNPISSTLDIMRPTPLVSLLESMQENHARKIMDMAIFEIGPAFFNAMNGQRLVGALLRSGQRHEKDWQNQENKTNLFDIKADIIAAIEAVGLQVTQLKIVQKNTPDYYHPGRSGSFMLGKTVIAHFGELHPSAAQDFSLKKTIYIGEIFIDNLPSSHRANKAKKKLNISPYQAVTRDFAFVLDEKITASELMDTIKKSEKKHLTDIKIFDYYQDASLGENKKSLALTVVLQPLEQSFTEEILEGISATIIAEVLKLGAELRQ